MLKSGWAAAAGLGSLVLLLTACGGSSSSSSAGTTPTATNTAAGQPTSAVGLPSPGTTIMMVQKSKLGYVLAEANGLVVYTYGKDTKGGSPACTGTCAATWLPVTGKPQSRTGDHLPAALGTVSDPNGAKQVTYNGMPLYTFKGAKALTVTGNGLGGLWHVVKLPASALVGG